jgi:UDP-glucose 4-epimerase
MKALVTGGAGFIGSHLSEALLAAGHEVVVLDDLSTGRIENLDPVGNHPRLAIVTGSIMDEALVQSLVQRSDVVYHLAAGVGVHVVLARTVASMVTNIMGTDIVLRAAARHHRRVTLASTAEVYGKNDRVPLREDDLTVVGPVTKSRWSYACAKAIDEYLALGYQRERDLPVVILRFFNTIGPRQTGRWGMVVPRFAQQALAGDPITIYGDGRQSRCFTDVADTVRAILLLSSAAGAAGEVFNVGNPREVSIGELARRIRWLAGSSSPIVHVPYEEAYGPGFDDFPRCVPDVGKAERLVGFRPGVALDDTLGRVIASVREGALAELSHAA